jgi:DNA-binding response OmpR family regulator
VVDDEQDLTFTLKATLEETGSFQVETFTDPVLALSEFKAGMYDLAVLDIRMPEMNGFQLYRKLRDMDNKLKICFLTATELLYYRETDSDIIDDLGTDCFVSKPVDNEDFVRKLKAIFIPKVTKAAIEESNRENSIISQPQP